MRTKTKVAVIAIEIITLIVLSFSSSVYSAQEKLKVVVNGQEINAEAKMIDNRVYVPIRAVSEALGANVNWDGNNKTAVISTTGSNNIVPEVIKTVSPSVVGIIGNWKDDVESREYKYSEDIIHGTGVVIKSGGEILTNAHVVKNMDRIVVVLSDGSGYEAKLKYIDEETDLAVVKIDRVGLQAANFGKDEDIIIGTTVIAIGTPVSFSLRNSASIGIISGVNRGIDSTYRLIQTDAAINPGNSGGPLVDLKGEVIGINSSKYSDVGIEGMGFSIPLNTIRYVLNHFEKYGEVKRPYLGAEFEESWAARVGLPTDSGLTIKQIKNDSPAKTQGLLEGDIVLSINDSKVNTLVDFNEEMKKYLPLDKVMFNIKREGIIQNLSITLGSN